MIKRKETKLIVENWRAFLKKEEKQKLNEIDLSSTYEYISNIVNTYSPTIAALGGASAGIIAVKYLYNSIINKIFKRPNNREAFKCYIEITKNFIHFDDEIRNDWIANKNIDRMVDKWIQNHTQKIIKNKVKQNQRSIDSSDIEIDLADEERVENFSDKIKDLLNSWNATQALKEFRWMISSGEQDNFDYDKLKKHKIWRQFVNTVDFNWSENDSELWDDLDDAEEFVILDRLFVAMLDFWKVANSSKSSKLKKIVRKLEKNMPEVYRTEYNEDTGKEIIVVNSNANIKQVFLIADIISKHEGKDSDSNLFELDFENNYDFQEYYEDRIFDNISRKEKLEILAKIIRWIKKIALTNFTGGLYPFLRLFLEEFKDDLIMGQVINVINNKIDQQVITENSDLKIQEFFKFLAKALLD